MNYIVKPNHSPAKRAAWTVKSAFAPQPKPATSKIITRRFDISWLNDEGDVRDITKVAPALPLFEDTCNAIAQGTLIQTPDGKVAVEDLHPGMMISTANGKASRLSWVGSMNFLPQSGELGLPECNLYRVTDGGYGLDRNGPDLMLGPGARILPGTDAVATSSSLVPVKDLVDGFSVISITPMSSVRLFHLCLEDHSLIRANGILLESYHPDENARYSISKELYEHFLGLFPHVANEADFGPASFRHPV